MDGIQCQRTFQEDEVQLDKAVSNIIGKEEEILSDELEDLLKITKDMETGVCMQVTVHSKSNHHHTSTTNAVDV